MLIGNIIIFYVLHNKGVYSFLYNLIKTLKSKRAYREGEKEYKRKSQPPLS
jgi:hypothetical protein